MLSKQLQTTHLRSQDPLFSKSPQPHLSEDFDLLPPVRNHYDSQFFADIKNKVQELNEQFQYKQANDKRYIKLIPVINLDAYAKVQNPLPIHSDKQEYIPIKQKPKLNPIVRPKNKNQRLLNFLIKAASSDETAPKIVQDIIADKKQQSAVKSRIQSMRPSKYKQNNRSISKKTLNPEKKKTQKSIDKPVSRCSSYNMIRVRHLEHKYNPVGDRNILKKGSMVAGAIINKLATEDQMKRINFRKSLYYDKHNQALPEDAVTLWNDKLVGMLEIMKGVKQKKVLKWQKKQSNQVFEWKEFNLDEEFLKEQF